MARENGRAEVQHYVPRFLLRGFLKNPQKKNQLFVFDKLKIESFASNVGNIAAERGFYSFDSDNGPINMESIFTDLEGNTVSAIDKIIETQSLAALDNNQKSWLSMFLAVQLLRTRHMKEVIKGLNEGMAEQIRKRGYDPKNTEGFKLLETEDDLKKALLAQMVAVMGEHATLMASKAAFLTTTFADRPFWISDHPVVMHNDRTFGPYGNIGLAVPGIQIYLPLTSKLLLALWCTSNADRVLENVDQAKHEKKELELTRVLGRDFDITVVDRKIEYYQTVIDDGEPLVEAMNKGSTVQATEENVDFYNHLQVKWSHRFLMSSRDDFALAKKMIADNPDFQTGFKPKVN